MLNVLKYSLGAMLLIAALYVTWATTTTTSHTVFAEGLTLADLEPGQVEVIIEDLDIPWEIVFISNEEMLVPMREGHILLINTDGEILERIEPVSVDAEGTVSGGSLGAVLHPEFDDNRLIYFFQTVQVDDTASNRVVRYTLDGERQLSNEEIIVENLPAALYHNGGRIKFGPDGHLYVTTGDTDLAETAQDTTNRSGKILRYTADGEIPPDNPFENAVWSYGHRNPQGLAWDAAGNLWSTEHGNQMHDELNFVEAGENYGWPLIEGAETATGLRAPILESGDAWTWAPSTLIHVDGNLFFGGLKGESLLQAEIDGSTARNLQAHFQHEFGRIRVVTEGPNGDFYLATSNTDGQGFGTVREGDNKIIRIERNAFDL